MSLLIEGIGDDWVVTRVPGGKPELTSFQSLSEFRQAMLRLLFKGSRVSSKPSIHLPVVTPQAVVIEDDDPLDLGEFPPGTDCRDCGACCGTQDHSKDVHVKLDEADFAQIPKNLQDSLVVVKSDGRFLKTKCNSDEDTVCAALSGTIGKRCKCGIYAKRPMGCRLFEPGSPECLIARRARQM